jgi:hypothetical protein
MYVAIDLEGSRVFILSDTMSFILEGIRVFTETMSFILDSNDNGKPLIRNTISI